MKELLNILCFNRIARMDYNDDEKKTLYLSGIVLCVILIVSIYITEY
jgi:hypothetical protein